MEEGKCSLGDEQRGNLFALFYVTGQSTTIVGNMYEEYVHKALVQCEKDLPLMQPMMRLSPKGYSFETTSSDLPAYEEFPRVKIIAVFIHVPIAGPRGRDHSNTAENAINDIKEVKKRIKAGFEKLVEVMYFCIQVASDVFPSTRAQEWRIELVYFAPPIADGVDGRVFHSQTSPAGLIMANDAGLAYQKGATESGKCDNSGRSDEIEGEPMEGVTAGSADEPKSPEKRQRISSLASAPNGAALNAGTSHELGKRKHR
ncbi:hypothetical protein BDP27DRAFT_1368499 [Rhodocollybia butyracea]|uniref:Uncharacterized protein n=1 Tax=Rhodocollybia butyracea TaxID=206335 RepID=A0A9P5PIV1_9AGAR|nr:hypothetical protein BDP27DRAFT_1368499 [Rhodocollybia butyracea]